MSERKYFVIDVRDANVRDAARRVPQQIRETDLGVYRRAGEISGFGVEVFAQPGQSFRFRGTKVVISSGFVGIEINMPDGAESNSPFWRALKQVRAGVDKGRRI